MSKLLLRRGTLQDLQSVIPDAGEPFYITDTKEQGIGDGINNVATLACKPANQDLSNLTATGEKHFLNKTQITNCIIEISQDIKLELNSGTLTLKAGSKVYVPNGFEEDGTTPKFDSIITSSDIASSSNWTSNPCMVALNSSQTGPYAFILSNQYSGSSAPASLNVGTIWYDTTNNMIKRYNGSAWESGVSFPLCIGTMVSGTGWTSIDQVFNGSGYIGSTVYALPGVKGLIPNGRNADGSLKNIEITTTAVSANTAPSSLTGLRDLVINENATIARGLVYYSNTENINRDTSATGERRNNIAIANCLYTSGVISTYKLRTAFHAIDYGIPHVVQTYINGTSWYRVYSDGWIEQGGKIPIRNSGNSWQTVNLLKSFANTNYTVTLSIMGTHENTESQGLKDMTISSFKVYAWDERGNGWYACGY